MPDVLLMAAVKVYCSRFLPNGGDWDAECRLCSESMWGGDWIACMEWAYGHLIFSHARVAGDDSSRSEGESSALSGFERTPDTVPVEPPC